ncbi:MAG: cytochrome B [Curvibacter sp. PD_MW3]|nr:MAG: cytochrome B [Curvibacter sp. PD_MW3]
MNVSTSLDTSAASSRPMTQRTRRVVDAPTRVFHWLFALSFLGAYLTADGERWRLLHVTLGYTMAGLLGFRVIYGLLGPRQARLSLLLRKLAGGPQWVRSALSAARGESAGSVNWRQGQYLLMALAVVSLLALVLPLTLSGYATYNEWGGDWLEELHEFVGNTFLVVVLGHLALIAGLSLLRRKNLAMNMVSGRVEGAGPDLVQRNHGLLAMLLLVAVLAFWAWEWQQSPKGLVPAQVWSGASTHNVNAEDDD